MKTNSAWLTGVMLSSVFVLAGGLAYGQAKPQPGHKMGSMKMNESQAGSMMADRQQMMADMKAMDQKLDGLVAKMNAAKGTDKVDAVAAAVSELVAQRTQMRTRMMSMQDGMMGHMMDHMQMGAQSMGNCPMMKGMAKERMEKK